MHCQPRHKRQVYIWLKNTQTCLICDEATESVDCVCNVCETELPWLMEQCEVCALPLPMEGLVCGQCQKYPPAFKQVVAPWSYSFPVDTLISRFKRERGYNQALMLARWLSAELDLEYDEHLLLRPHETVAQQTLDAKARRRNLLSAFALAPGAQVQGRHLALVDDVLTTGATAHSLAQLLMEAGARQVDVYCLARTPKPGA